MSNRPYLGAKIYTWRDKDGTPTPGIGLFRNGSLHSHLTADECRRFADKLHDLADAAGNPEPVLPTTEAEQE